MQRLHAVCAQMDEVARGTPGAINLAPPATAAGVKGLAKELNPNPVNTGPPQSVSAASVSVGSGGSRSQPSSGCEMGKTNVTVIDIPNAHSDVSLRTPRSRALPLFDECGLLGSRPELPPSGPDPSLPSTQKHYESLLPSDPYFPFAALSLEALMRLRVPQEISFSHYKRRRLALMEEMPPPPRVVVPTDAEIRAQPWFEPALAAAIAHNQARADYADEFVPLSLPVLSLPEYLRTACVGGADARRTDEVGSRRESLSKNDTSSLFSSMSGASNNSRAVSGAFSADDVTAGMRRLAEFYQISP